MGVHKGSWWPIYVPDFYGPRCSQHPLDPYSLTHVEHGFIFYALLVAIPDAIHHSIHGANLPWWWALIVAAIIASALEIIWEVIENSEFVLKRFRDTNGISGMNLVALRLMLETQF